jgi:hypothetical protein
VSRFTAPGLIMSAPRDTRLRMDQEIDEEESLRELEKVLGPSPKPMPGVTTGTLDEVLASRTHVRVLRVLVALDRRLNLTARDVARRAMASHPRVLEVLEQLSSLGMVTAHRTPTHAIYCLAENHPLTGAVRSLFHHERRTCEEASALGIIPGGGRLAGEPKR